MAFLTGVGSTKSLDSVFGRLEGAVRAMDVAAQHIRAQSAAGTLVGDDVVRYYNALGSNYMQLQDAIAGVDIADATTYARERYNDPTYDVQAEYTALRAAALDVLQWLETNVSASALLDFDAVNHQVTYATYTAAQTAGFRTVLDALIAQID